MCDHTEMVSGNRLLTVAVAAAALAACSADTDEFALRDPSLPFLVDDSVVLTAADDRPMAVKVFVPETGGPYPLIVLSHGTFSNRHRYDRIAEFWAGQGYVVMLPQHKDGDYGVRPTSYEVMQDVIRTRVADMSLVLDELDVMTAAVPALVGRIARDSFVAAGHSVGTQVAMLVTGARFRTGFDGELMESDETRYRALILVSDPGKMRLMPAETWTASAVPTLMATGTDDYGLMGSRGPSAEAQTEVLIAGEANDISRYELLLDGGDHYFGGLVQKDVEAEPDHEGLTIFNAVSTAFLDATMKDDPSARMWLDTIDVPRLTDGRATLTRH